jgi:hypothetical protein
MMLSTHAATMPRRVPPNPPPNPPPPGAESGTNPIGWFGPIEDEDHILVLGGQGPELMCALLHAGATNVTHLRGHERPEPDSASLVIVPRTPSLDWLATALPSIRRALVANGRLVIRGGTLFNFEVEARHTLALHGFTSIHATHIAEGQVLVAENRPPCSHRAIGEDSAGTT